MSRAQGHDRRVEEFPIPTRALARAADDPLPLRFGGLDLDTLRRLVQYEVAEARTLAAETKPGGLTHVDVPSTFP